MASTTDSLPTTYTDPEEFLRDVMTGHAGDSADIKLRVDAANALLRAKFRRERIAGGKKSSWQGKKEMADDAAAEVVASGGWNKLIN